MTQTHVLFEEDGVFKAGSVLNDAGTSLQVESATGKRTKVKATSVMLRFPEPSPADLMQRAQGAAAQIDLDFLWACAPQDEFEFLTFAADYFGHAPSAVEAASLLLRLHGAPIYFYRKGKGRYRAAPDDTLKAALAAVERKAQQQRTIEEHAQQLAEGELPEPIAREAVRLLIRPDKNSVEWKTLERACEVTRQPPERLLLAVGAFADARALHLARFLAEYFPHGQGFQATDDAAIDAALREHAARLPLSEAITFSIDDSTTTEIDDCLSVQALASGRLRIGIHIAAPALAIRPGESLDAIARERMSTLYMPGDKVTMLPEGPIDRFSLAEGRELPALSLYADLDETGTRVLACDSRVERIRVGHNLRHDHLEDLITERSLEPLAPGIDDPLAALPQADALRSLWRLTLALSEERDRVRGKPEPRNRLDFSFYVEGDTVRIVQRRRDAPLDRIVAEMMILANREWGALLAARGVPGIYRSQQAAGRVRMSTQALPHQGLGVPQYCWSTSPLRRYVDLVNQRQLIAVLSGEKPPYAGNDTDLFAVISAFDTRYAAYAEFQQRMERYWCLRWIGQQPSGRLEAVVVRDELARLAQAPLYFRLPELPSQGLASGRRILVDILETDEVDLSVSARLIEPLAESLSEPPSEPPSEQVPDELADALPQVSIGERPEEEEVVLADEALAASEAALGGNRDGIDNADGDAPPAVTA